MTKHRGYKTAANLIFWCAGLGSIRLPFSKLESNNEIVWSIYGIIFLLWVGSLIIRGYAWVKYLLLVLVVIGLLSAPFAWEWMLANPWDALLYLAQTAIQIGALVILFKIKKDVEEVSATIENDDASNLTDRE